MILGSWQRPLVLSDADCGLQDEELEKAVTSGRCDNPSRMWRARQTYYFPPNGGTPRASLTVKIIPHCLVCMH